MCPIRVIWFGEDTGRLAILDGLAAVCSALSAPGRSSAKSDRAEDFAKGLMKLFVNLYYDEPNMRSVEAINRTASPGEMIADKERAALRNVIPSRDTNAINGG
jgi:hypothetical protein